jgi:8-oxo-dGTP diphosphatase
VLFDHLAIHGSCRVRVRVAGFLIQNNSLLLIAHKKKGEIYWLLPGGGVRYGESLKQALKREFREELSIEIDVHELLFICDSIEPHGRKHILNITFRCASSQNELHLGSDRRLHDFGFFNRREISEKTLYPPINNTLISILKNKKKELYLGSLWLV